MSVKLKVMVVVWAVMRGHSWGFHGVGVVGR